MLRTALFFVIVIGLVACASGGKGKPPRAKALKYATTFPVEGLREPALDGVWSSPSMSAVIEFSGSDWRLYRRVGKYCWEEAAPGSKTEFAAFIPEYSLMTDLSSVTFRQRKRVGEISMKPLELLPAECLQTLERVEVFDVFVELMRERYPFFSRRGVVWATQSAAVRRGFNTLENDEALRKAMLEAIKGLNDPQLILTIGNQQWRDDSSAPPVADRLEQAYLSQNQISGVDNYIDAWRQAVRSALKKSYLVSDVSEAFDGSLLWGVDQKNVGYLRIGRAAPGPDGAWVAAVRAVDKALSGTNALILDLSMLTGGDGAAVDVLAAWLIGTGNVAYKQRVHTRPESEWRDVSANTRIKTWRKPVFVVASSLTQGAAERLMLTLRGRPNVHFIGEQSIGSMAGLIRESLPNGWIMTVPSIMLADRDEVQFEGLGIAPDFALDLFPAGGLSRAHPLAMRTLSDLIAEGHFN